MTRTKAPDVPAVLARHGIAPDAGADALEAGLAARGWALPVEDVTPSGGAGKARRFRVVATRRGSAGTPRPFAEHLQATGSPVAAPLARVLAKALAREEGA